LRGENREGAHWVCSCPVAQDLLLHYLDSVELRYPQLRCVHRNYDYTTCQRRHTLPPQPPPPPPPPVPVPPPTVSPTYPPFELPLPSSNPGPVIHFPNNNAGAVPFEKYLITAFANGENTYYRISLISGGWRVGTLDFPPLVGSEEADRRPLQINPLGRVGELRLQFPHTEFESVRTMLQEEQGLVLWWQKSYDNSANCWVIRGGLTNDPDWPFHP
jgi:hypothetical protein